MLGKADALFIPDFKNRFLESPDNGELADVQCGVVAGKLGIVIKPVGDPEDFVTAELKVDAQWPVADPDGGALVRMGDRDVAAVTQVGLAKGVVIQVAVLIALRQQQLADGQESALVKLRCHAVYAHLRLRPEDYPAVELVKRLGDVPEQKFGVCIWL